MSERPNCKFHPLPMVLALTAAAGAFVGCGKNSSETLSQIVESEASTDSTETVQGTRDNTPKVLVPKSPGTTVLGTDTITIDISNASDGYLSVSCRAGDDKKRKLRITPPNDVVYTFDLASDGTLSYYPFSCGDGSYRIAVYENVEGNKYAAAFDTTIEVSLTDSLTPFLYPNTEVWFTSDTKAVAVAEETVVPANSDLDAISEIYDYVITHVTYDWDEAETVQSGYIPDVDEVLETGKGICVDFSALLCAMLRSQRIPTRVEVGYAGDVYHAWVSTYVEDVGWVNGIIRFDGTDWSLMDA
ncbi:MAG: transglutaminase family protein, partial [Lachnospiraceae bacterium]